MKDKYHCHLEDIKNGAEPVELTILSRLCNLLEIDMSSISKEKIEQCLSAIWIQINDITIGPDGEEHIHFYKNHTIH